MGKDGMNYAPPVIPSPVVKPGEFCFAVVSLDHGHIYGMCEALIAAGAALKWVYDPDDSKTDAFCKHFPGTLRARSEDEILCDKDILLVAGAAVPSLRCALGLRVMGAGKDYFTDKSPFTTLEQLESAKEKCNETGQKYMVYYSERLHNEASVYASKLIQEGAIGRVIQVMGLGPHRLNAPSRPGWFFEKEKYGGILCDIGSHQIEQFLHFSGSEDSVVTYARAANLNNPLTPELEDFGETALVSPSGASGYFRVDWFTPDGLRTWGDGRTFILGTDGYIELRKYINLAATKQDDNHLLIANAEGEYHINATGKAGYPFFGELILDCLNRTENAMTQRHAFLAAELCMKAQAMADNQNQTFGGAKF